MLRLHCYFRLKPDLLRILLVLQTIRNLHHEHVKPSFAATIMRILPYPVRHSVPPWVKRSGTYQA